MRSCSLNASGWARGAPRAGHGVWDGFSFPSAHASDGMRLILQIIDELHIKNHVDEDCRKRYKPVPIKS